MKFIDHGNNLILSVTQNLGLWSFLCFDSGQAFPRASCSESGSCMAFNLQTFIEHLLSILHVPERIMALGIQ